MTAPSPAPARPRHPNLIDQLSADAIASDYGLSDPQAQPHDPNTRRARRQRLVVAASGLALTGFVLAMGLSAKITNEPAVMEQRKALRERVVAAETTQIELGKDVEKLRGKVEKARATSLELSLLGLQLARDISELELITGYTAVTGPGVTVTMSDAAEPSEKVDPALTKVLDSDVQSAVNGLWQAGAEAVAINGQRLSARSAIRSAAGAILVNYRPLRPPYVIEAIGDPDQLLSRFEATADAKSLKAVSRQFGIGFTTANAPKLDLPAASGRLPDTAVVVTEEQTKDAGKPTGKGRAGAQPNEGKGEQP